MKKQKIKKNQQKDFQNIETITNELDQEGRRFVSLMPTMASIAGSLLGDMIEIFGVIGESILAEVSNVFMDYYESKGDTIRTWMRMAGFSPEEAIARRTKSSLKGSSIKSIAKSLGAVKVADDSWHEEDIKYAGLYFGYFL